MRVAQSLYVIFYISGDQISTKDGQNLFINAADVVQMSAATLLWLVVHLLAWLCQHKPL